MPDPLNAVVDLSHHNGAVDLLQAKGDGIIGVIHKATQGQTGLDPMYQANKAKAATAGLLWGAYHFATGGDGVEQAQHFLDVVGNTDNTLLVLDFEQNPSGTSMSMEDARGFVTHINEVTAVFQDCIPARTSKNCSAVARIPCSHSAGSGWRNMVQQRSCLLTGRRGPCGNTPTAQSGLSRIRSPASATAIATSSTAPRIN